MSLTGSTYTDLKYYLRYGNMVTKLILVNVGVFFALKLLYVAGFLAQYPQVHTWLLNHLQVPADLHQLAMQPWSLVTYMFLHDGFMHILFNLLWLFWFGQIFMLYLGDKRILPLYFLGGLAGALFYIGAYNLFPVFAPQASSALMMGASASAMAIVFGATAINPDHQVQLILFGLVRIKFLALFTLLLDIISIPTGNAGGHLAHLGGAAAGFAYIRMWQSGFDLFGFLDFKKVKKGPKLVYKRPYHPTGAAADNITQTVGGSEIIKTRKNSGDNPSGGFRQTLTDQEKLDEILDKISQSGYDSLSKEEKEFLFLFSNKN